MNATENRIKIISYVGISMLTTTVFCILIAEAWLAFQGYPKEVPLKIAHPPSYSETRYNIEFTHEFVTNSQGLRYPEIPVEPQSEKELRILLLGDSYAEGLGIEYKKSFGALLEREFSKPGIPVRFINAGLTGAGPLEYARVLYHRGLKYKPDHVLLIIHSNDVADTQPMDAGTLEEGAWLHAKYKTNDRAGLRRALHAVLPRLYVLLSTTREQWARRYPIDVLAITQRKAREEGVPEAAFHNWKSNIPAELIEASNNGRFNAHLITQGLIKPESWVQALDIEGSEAERRWATMAGILDAIHDLCAENEIGLSVVFAPSPLHYDASYSEFLAKAGTEVRDHWTGGTVLEDRLQRWAESKGHAWLNLTQHLKEANQSRSEALYYALDGHWTAAGHRLVAQRLRSWIRSGIPSLAEIVSERGIVLAGNQVLPE